MEKATAIFGSVIFSLCFFIAMFTVNTWLWGCVVGLMITLFGLFFWEE